MQGSASIKIRPVIFFVLCSITCLLFWFCSANPPLDPSENNQQEFDLLVGLASSPEIVPLGGSSIITAFVLDEESNPVAGQQIQFSVNVGTILPETVTTDDSGRATAIFTAPQQATDALITARQNESSVQTVAVQVLNSTPQSISIAAEEPAILANGLSTTRITTVWRNDAGEPLKGIPVSFEANVGLITALTPTDSFGVAIVDFQSVASRTDVVAQITATGNGIQAVTQVWLRGINFSVNITPTSLIADGRNQAAVQVILKEITSSVAISDGAVTFGATLGTITNSGFTGSNGVLETFLTSANDTGVSVITVTYGRTITETMQVVFGQSVPSNLNVTAQPGEILADNQSSSTITAVVSDQGNNPVSDGTPVRFEIVSGSGTIESNKVTTDGVATSRLTSSTTPDTVQIAVLVAQLTDTVNVRYVIGPAAVISVVSDSSSLRADGSSSTRIVVFVNDGAGNPVQDGTKVDFTTTIGDISSSALTSGGVAVAQFSSTLTGNAIISASVGGVSDQVTVLLRPGPPNSILLVFTPKVLGVQFSAIPTTSLINAEVRDSEANVVVDGTYVLFSIVSGPGGGESLSTDQPVPTLNGRAQISFNTGVRSGTAKIQALITDETGTPIILNGTTVRASSTEILIYGGPPYIEDVNARSTSHLSVGVGPQNIFGWNIVERDAATVIAVVGDRFNNPVPPGTVVHFTTTAGNISTVAETDEHGVATVTFKAAQPYPTIDRYYGRLPSGDQDPNFVDPNLNHPNYFGFDPIIPGPIPDFDGSEVVNSLGDMVENDGVARILAWTEGVTNDSSSARVWSVTNLVMSGIVSTFTVEVEEDTLAVDESTAINVTIYDDRGNPIVAESNIAIRTDAGQLSTELIVQSEPAGSSTDTHYTIFLINNLEPKDLPASTRVTFEIVNSPNSTMVVSSELINLTF